jgi:MarR family
VLYRLWMRYGRPGGDHIVAAGNLTAAQLFLLTVLVQSDSLRISDLAAAMRGSQPPASVITARLLRSGLVTRMSTRLLTSSLMAPASTLRLSHSFIEAAHKVWRVRCASALRPQTAVLHFSRRLALERWHGSGRIQSPLRTPAPLPWR